MAYIHKQKLNIRELVGIADIQKKVLVAEPEEYLLALYVYHLGRNNFFVRPCIQVDSVVSELESFAPHLLVVNSRLWGAGRPTGLKLQNIRQHFPELLIITVGMGSDLNDTKAFMNTAVNAHIDRKLSQPADVAAIAHSLFFKA